MLNGYCVKSLAPSVKIFMISKLCVVKNVIPALSMNNAAYTTIFPIIIKSRVANLVGCKSSGLLASNIKNITIDYTKSFVFRVEDDKSLEVEKDINVIDRILEAIK